MLVSINVPILEMSPGCIRHGWFSRQPLDRFTTTEQYSSAQAELFQLSHSLSQQAF